MCLPELRGGGQAIGGLFLRDRGEGREGKRGQKEENTGEGIWKNKKSKKFFIFDPNTYLV